MAKKIRRRSAIQKGRGFQKRIKELFKAKFNLTDDDIRTPIGAENGPDLIFLSDLARKTIPFAVEMKNQKNISVWKELEQACDHAKKLELPPALIFKRGTLGSNRTWITIELDEFIKLLGRG